MDRQNKKTENTSEQRELSPEEQLLKELEKERYPLKEQTDGTWKLRISSPLEKLFSILTLASGIGMLVLIGLSFSGKLKFLYPLASIASFIIFFSLWLSSESAYLIDTAKGEIFYLWKLPLLSGKKSVAKFDQIVGIELAKRERSAEVQKNYAYFYKRWKEYTVNLTLKSGKRLQLLDFEPDSLSLYREIAKKLSKILNVPILSENLEQ